MSAAEINRELDNQAEFVLVTYLPEEALQLHGVTK
jgi:hypothetical protein